VCVCVCEHVNVGKFNLPLLSFLQMQFRQSHADIALEQRCRNG